MALLWVPRALFPWIPTTILPQVGNTAPMVQVRQLRPLEVSREAAAESKVFVIRKGLLKIEKAQKPRESCTP